ncbi:Transposase, Ptta/En/Spm, plant [Quillaja saponaria]|uniref:Transposase, Ptta/En/Spm, plant n=1 Tax=Quillaja saponaria TaxID=32244 RepID=A0AAD7LTQ6_QUISA|nr:Transposase, Ptta/En/Spm, plant [Quillaja saponaria]
MIQSTTSNARNMARVKSRSQNPLDWRGFDPGAIRSEYFNELCETTWNTKEWKHKSAAAMKNRSSMPEASVHVGGSRIFVRHKEIMEKELKRPFRYKELFDWTHKRKTGEFVSQHSQNVNEGYSGRVIEKYREDGSSSFTEPIIDMDAWLCSTGQPKKGRVYGFGRTLDPCYSRSLSSASVSSHPTSSLSSEPVSEEHFLSIMRTEMRTELRTEIQIQNQEIRSYVDNALKGVVDVIKQLTTFFSQSSRARGHQKGKAKGKYRRQADNNVEDEDDDDESDEDLGDDD